VRACTGAVQLVHKTAGLSAIHKEYLFERLFRDVHPHAARLKKQFTSRNYRPSVFGLDNDWTALDF